MHRMGSYSPFSRYNGHSKFPTNSSVASSISAISDRSFVEDFHSISAELESIDQIVRSQVESGSMASIFSDFGLNEVLKDRNSKEPQTGNAQQIHTKNNTSSYSEESCTQNRGYCSSVTTSEPNSLRSELFLFVDPLFMHTLYCSLIVPSSTVHPPCFCHLALLIWG